MKYFAMLLIALAVLGIVYAASPLSVKETAWSFAPLVLQIFKAAEGPTPPADPLSFSVPEGFAVSLFSKDAPNARALTRDPQGRLVVSLTKSGKVVVLPDADNNKQADSTVTILEGLNNPHGIVFNCSTTSGAPCMLYVAEEHAVKSYLYDPEHMTAALRETLAELPPRGGHFTRSLLLHPDGERLLVAVGSSCNMCNEEDPRRASILAVNLKTKEVTTFARGLRNTVFMATHPVSGEVWGTDMGRDLLGDNLPPDEVNILREGGNYGWPACYGKNIHDTEFDTNTYIRAPCTEPFETPSHIDIPAHSAPLGIDFIPEEGWPEEYRFSTIVAYHGSWNRSTPTGYKLVRFPIDGRGNPLPEEDFMTGFIRDGEVIGRPVDVLIEPGGTMYVSDDKAGAVYRVYRTGEM